MKEKYLAMKNVGNFGFHISDEEARYSALNEISKKYNYYEIKEIIQEESEFWNFRTTIVRFIIK